MNKTYKLFGGAMMLLGLTLGSCTPDSFEGGDINGLPNAADYEQYVHVNVNQETNYAVFSFDELPGVTPVWNINGRYSIAYVDSNYYRKKGDYSVSLQVRNRNGMSDGQITKTFTINQTRMDGFGGFVEDSEYNMWRQATIKDPEFYYAPGWGATITPPCTRTGYDYSLSLSTATNERWQAQMKLNTDITTTSDKFYDFSVILVSNTDLPGVTIKLTNVAGDVFYFDDQVEFKAGEPKCFWKSNFQGKDIENLQLVFDFGGNPDNSSISIESIVLKDHANDDGTIVPEETVDDTVYDYDAATNLWKPFDADASLVTTAVNFSPGWVVDNSKMTLDINNGTYTTNIAEASNEQWQAWFKLTAPIACEANGKYDFSCTLNASADMNGATVKVADADDENNNVLLAEQVNLTAGTDYVLKVPASTFPAGAENVVLVFDFGGNPAGLKVDVSKIVLQKTIE